MSQTLIILYHSRDNSSRYERQLRAEVQSQVQTQNARFWGDEPCLVSLKRGIEAYLIQSGTTGKYQRYCQHLPWRVELIKGQMEIRKVTAGQSRLVMVVEKGGGRI